MKVAAVLGCLMLVGCVKKEPAAWDKTEVMIPARDGVKLHTLIFAPKNTSEKLPFLMERSPYGFDNAARSVRVRPVTRSSPTRDLFSSCRIFVDATNRRASS